MNECGEEAGEEWGGFEITQHALGFFFSPMPPIHVANPEAWSIELSHDTEMHELVRTSFSSHTRPPGDTQCGLALPWGWACPRHGEASSPLLLEVLEIAPMALGPEPIGLSPLDRVSWCRTNTSNKLKSYFQIHTLRISQKSFPKKNMTNFTLVILTKKCPFVDNNQISYSVFSCLAQEDIQSHSCKTHSSFYIRRHLISV